jgi:hypothetical protein
MEWQPIETAPKERTFIDIAAKQWRPHYDDFTWLRFPDCYWYHPPPDSNTKPGWQGVKDGWRPTHWMPIPELPKDQS